MRIRSTKPEFWRSKRIASVDWESRLVLKGLESYVDDNGVGKDDLALIVTDVFPRDMADNPQDTLLRVQAAVNTLSQAGLVHRYEADGTDLLYVSFWEQVQYINRPSKGRLPRPDGTFEYGDSEIGAPLLSPQEGDLSPQSLNRGSGNRDQGSVTSASAPAERDDPDEFDEWYEHYPRKKGKGQAMKAYRAARKIASAETLLTAVKAQAPGLIAKGAEYCPYPATWLNGRRWEDEDEPAGKRPSDHPRPGTPEFAALTDEQKVRILEREQIREFNR